MTLRNGQLVGALILWSVFVIQFARAFIFRRSQLRAAWRIWVAFFLGCVTFTLWGEHIDAEIERIFGGLPLGVYIKFYTFILVAHLNLHILGDVEPRALENRLVRWMAPVTLVAATLLLAGAWLWGWRLSAYGRLGVVVVRDLLLATYIIAVFLPINRDMRRSEQNPVMRFRLTATAGFSASYLFVAVGNIIVFLLTTFESPLASSAQQLFHPLIFLCVIFFTLMFLPKQCIATFNRLRRLVVAFRVHRFAQKIASLAAQPTSVRVSWVSLLWQPGRLDDQIYRDVIFILDYAPQVSETEGISRLLTRLRAAGRRDIDYEQLVRELVKF